MTIEPQGVRVVSVNEAERRFLPLEMHGVANDETLWTWLTRRTVPKHRHYIQMMLGNLGIMQKGTRGIIEMCKGLSLNDVYWVVPDGFSGAWKDFNLYDNPFSKTLAVMAFTGGFRGEFNPAREETTSPEFTTNGMLAKCWRRREEGVFLFKGGTEGAANAGFEPYTGWRNSKAVFAPLVRFSPATGTAMCRRGVSYRATRLLLTLGLRISSFSMPSYSTLTDTWGTSVISSTTILTRLSEPRPYLTTATDFSLLPCFVRGKGMTSSMTYASLSTE